MSLTSFITPVLYFVCCMSFSQNINFENKIILDSIREEVIVVLEYFPELYDTPIEFKFKVRIRKYTLQPQPKICSIYRNKKNRKYVILISREIHIDEENFTIDDIPSDVIIGWLGHELGHLMDYQNRSSFGMIVFGAKYLFSNKSIQEVERTADTYAIGKEMSEYILKTKNFILENANISERYKARIRRLYISPEEVMELINEGQVEEKLDVVELGE